MNEIILCFLLTLTAACDNPQTQAERIAELQRDNDVGLTDFSLCFDDGYASDVFCLVEE